MINQKTTYIMKNITRKTHSVPTINGKEKVAWGKTFQCYQKDWEALMRMYGSYFEKVENKTLNIEKEIKKVVKKETNEVVITPTKEEIIKQKADKELQQVTEAFEKQEDKKVPVNKKNDLKWIKSKLKSL